MSTNLDTSVGPTNRDDVHPTSFNGGDRGQMLQLTQGHVGGDLDIIKIDKAQARHLVGVMQAWLDGQS